jgi:tetratricopeptide (TPR) repeat protein
MKHFFNITLKKILIGILLIFSASELYAQIDTIIIPAKKYFDQKSYSQGFLLLNNRLFAYPLLDSLSKAKVQYELAVFYERYVGDLDKSLQYYRQITEANFKGNYNFINQAHEREESLSSLISKYRDVNNEFVHLKSLSNQQNTKEIYQDITFKLKKLILLNPDFYGKAEVYYFLGLNYIKLERFGRANKYFHMALEEKPAIDYLVPISSGLQDSSKSFTNSFARKFSSIFLGIFIFTSIILFYCAKPWIWYTWKHLKVLLVLIVLWVLMYFIIFIIVGKSISNFHIINNTFLSDKIYFNYLPGSSGSQPAWGLFLYGFYAIIGLYIFSVGVSVFSIKWIRIIVIPVVGFLLFFSAASTFYVKYVNGKAVTIPANEAFWQKSYFYGTRAIEPYVLTNPKAYPNLNTESVTNDVLLEWVKEHCPFDNQTKQKANSPK